MSNRKTSIVTGGSRGIGRGIVLALARGGFDVVVNYARNQAAAQDVGREVEALGGRAVLIQADIALAADRARLVEEAFRAMGRIDLLVNNAGVAPEVRADLLEASEESFDRVLGINLKGPYFLTQLVARKMIEGQEKREESSEKKESEDKAEGRRQKAEGQAQTYSNLPVSGRTAGALPPSSLATNNPQPATLSQHFAAKIVNITSVSAYTASINRGDYCVAKAGLAMMTQLFAARLAQHGINVYEIRPGVIETDMTGPVKAKYDDLIFNKDLTPIHRWGQADDVARAVLAIASDLLPFSTGEVINVDGGFHLRRL